jgi:hypothetical protein
LGANTYSSSYHVGEIAGFVFALVSVPPFNTPVGFTGLQSAVRRADETRDAAFLPGAVQAALRDCATASS